MASDDELGGESFEGSRALTGLQEGMLFESLTARGADPNVIQVIGDLREEIDPELFAAAWQRVTERHGVLRMSFGAKDGHLRDGATEGHRGATEGHAAWVGRVHGGVRVPFVFRDLAGLGVEEREGALEELARNEGQGFELGAAPLMRVALARCGAGHFRMVWTVHHLVVDAQSFAVILRDVFGATHGQLMEGHFTEGKSVISESVISRSVVRGEGEEDFWRRKLEGFSGATQLGVTHAPAEGHHGPGRRGESREQRLELSESLGLRLRELAGPTDGRRGTSLTTVMQGAWGVLLSRYSGEEDVLFGVVRAGRGAGRRSVIGESVISKSVISKSVISEAGLFIRVLPLRVRVSPEMGVLDLLGEVRRGWKELRDHEGSSLSEIQCYARFYGGSPGSYGRSPYGRSLFDTLVSVQDPPWDEVLRREGGAWSGRSFEVRNRTGYGASLDVSAGARVRLTLNYTTVSDEAARRVLEHLEVILEQFASYGRSRKVREIEVLTEGERGLLAEVLRTVPIDLSRRVEELVTEQGRRAPDALAVQCGMERLSYGELVERAEALGSQLRGAGAGPNTTVAVYMERSVDLVVALLGVLKAGGAYVPIDVGYPKNRVEYMIGDSQAAVVLTHRKLAKGLDVGGARVVSLDAIGTGIGDGCVDSPRGAEDLAYVIYTSGSTGRPKGVAVEHRSLLNLVQWHQSAYQVTAADRATQIASPAFDAAVWEIWPYLAAGASIHIPDEETRTSAARLVGWLKDEEITMAFLPTPLAEAAMAEEWPKESALRFLLTGGDQLRRRPPADASYKLVNHYGPTENTVVTTAGEVSPSEAGLPAIGRPISNVQAHVLDRHLQAVPLGVTGELCVAGESLARGYWNRPELTAERFVMRADGTRLYRTGDLARWRADGQIEFLGRLDNQVKIRGYRIELGEIECALRAHSSVADAVVVAQPIEQGGARLVGYVVLQPGAQSADLRAYLRESLPDYMVPDAFVPVECLPLTSNGKLDRKALPAVEFASSAPRYSAPRNATEDVLAGIWSDVLQRERVGIDDNFFSLGGHSLSGTQVIGRARNALGTELPLSALFNFPTIRQLGEHIGGSGNGSGAETIPMGDGLVGQEVPLSFAQERLWFFEQFEPGKPINNIGICLEVQGALDVVALEGAASEMVRRHASLRTVFVKHEGRPLGRIVPAEPLRIIEQDLRQFPESERERSAVRMAEAAARDVFDLVSGPLLRLQVFKFGGDRYWIVLVMHHIASDGWSMAVVYRELSQLYGGAKGSASAMTPLRIHYPDFARWQRGHFEQGGLSSDLAYWRSKLGGKLPVLDLPCDRPRTPVQTYNGAIVPLTLAPDLTRRLEALARREDVTLYMLLLAGFKAVLHRYSGQEDIIVGTAVAGRTRPETEDLIGMFVNTLPLRTSISSEMSFRELLNVVRETALGAYAHQQLPFEKLVEAVQVERDLSRSPLFQVMVVLQSTPGEAPTFDGTEVQIRTIHTGTAKYDLTVSLEKAGENLSGYLEFNSDLFDRATIERLCGHYEILLRSAVEDCEARIGELPLLAAAEREQLLVTWNATETTYPRHRCVHESFQEQVERTPEAVAAVFEDEQMTYRQLNGRANAIAAQLKPLGVGPESRVGICLHRSLEMLAGLLGILKAGAAYVPLDPAYPKERLTLMLEDAQVDALLTEESLASGFAASTTKIVCVETIAPREVNENPASGAVSDNLAYVIYTSGSTGKPKGVMIRHRNVANFFAGMDHVLGTTPGVWLAVTSICFDISVLELLWTVTRGFKVVIQSDQGGLRANAARGPVQKGVAALEGYEIPEQIRRNRITHFQCTPSLMGMLLQEKGAREAIASVNTVLLGGEALTVSLLDQLQDVGRIVNMYGPTETTVWSTSQVIERDEPITVGRPMANTKIYILDRFQQPVPIGVPGELHIGGEGVVRGYLNRAELTAERFVPYPYAKEPGERMYRTGDLARYRADGRIEFLGRLDHQVKLRGFRIELGEIESALRQFDGVREAVVVVRELNANDKRLAAYLVAEKSIEPAQLRRGLKEKLPDYMVPSLFTFLPQMPLTPNGKIDRKALPEPNGLRMASATAFVPAQSDVERTIVRIWRELLCVETVGLNDNFFDLGGHSLLMVQAQARLSAAFGVDVPVIRLFQYPTVSALAKLFGEAPKEPVVFDKIRDRARMQRKAFANRPTMEVIA